MPFELTVALRYIRSGRLQSILILAGVAVGIVVFTFMAALINGLAVRLTTDVIGNIAHVRLEAPTRLPRTVSVADSSSLFVAVQRGGEPRTAIDGWKGIEQMVSRVPGVVTAVASVTGSGVIQRGEKIGPIQLIGYETGRESDMVDLAGGIVRGSSNVGPGEVLIGVTIASDLGLTTGQRIRVRSDRGRERALLVRGIFDVKSASVNERLAFTELGTAQSLLDLAGRASRIELKVADIYQAPRIAEELAGMTGLEGVDWISENARLQDALRAQASSGNLVKAFAILLIVIAVASQLLLSANRRRSEIGIMRSMGVSRGSVTGMFLTQGFLIGIIGSCLGAMLGYGFAAFLKALTLRPDGTHSLPIEPALGEYAVAITVATLASSLAAILPARVASRVDPVEVIQQ
ncbi:MAG: FtsX-like permease family protein [Gemmatimonadaceae bacterium]